MMQLRGTIVNITITEEKILSLRLRIEDQGGAQVLKEISKQKGDAFKYTLAAMDDPSQSIYFTGGVKSMSMSKALSVILHAALVPALLLKAVDLIGKPAYLRVTTDEEQELMTLLKAAAALEGGDPDDILFRLTTFTKEGRTFPGKRSIYDVSLNQRKVVLMKLHRSLSEPAVHNVAP